MDLKVKSALEAAVKHYAIQIATDAQSFSSSLLEVFDFQLPFLEKTAQLDQVFDDAPKFDALRESIFDLLMINFFVSDSKDLDEDYLESQEWEEIEEKTIDRGTELLNLLLYINECKEEKIQPDLSDFLKEFLLVEEDEFQDEHRIYEDFITHQDLVDANVATIIESRSKLDLQEEVAALFVPCMSFFHAPKLDDKVIADLTVNNEDKAIDVAVYALLTSYNQS